MVQPGELVLHELGGRDDIRYSQFAWRSVMALAHKGLSVRRVPVRVSDKEAISFSGQHKVPILLHGDAVVHDSWRIAEYLDAQFPDSPLFDGVQGQSYALFVNSWVDRLLIPMLAPILMIDVVACVEKRCASHLRAQIEGAFGNSLEALAEGRDAALVRFSKALEPARATVKRQAFLSGPAPAYPDYILFSLFQWARITSNAALLREGDLLGGWVERMLDLHGGLARAEPARAAREAREA